MSSPENIEVLVVDSDATLAQAMHTILTTEGFRVAVARDGEEGLKKFQELSPRVVVLEGLIPKLNGVDLAKAIRSTPAGVNVGILMVSAVYSGVKFRPQLREAGIGDVLAKPFRPEVLAERVRALDAKSALQPAKTVQELRSRPFDHKGSIQDVPFIRIVFVLHTSHDTGTLRLEQGSTKKLVTFENGEPKLVVSNLERECLGQLLVKKGRLTTEECQRSIEMMSKMKKRQGETLIQMGLLEPFELEETLKQQAREKFCEIFAWREGTYLYVPGRVFRKELTPVDLSVPQLCLRGVKEHYSLAGLQQELAGCLDRAAKIPKGTPYQTDEFKLATWDTKIVQQLRHGKTVKQILQARLARDLDVYHLVYTFFMLGMIEFEGGATKVEHPPAAEPRPSTPFELLGISAEASDEEVRRAFEAKVNEVGDDPARSARTRELREAYAAIATAQGRRDYFIRLYEKGEKLPPEGRDSFAPRELIDIGKKYLEKKDFKRARQVFTDAVNFFPDEGLPCTYLGYSVLRAAAAGETVDNTEKERAKKAMIRGTQLSPNDAETHYLVGRIFALEKNYEKALAAFRKTLAVKPNFLEAASELRLIERRMEKEKETSFIKWKR
ncbi:MAG TPA: response regulator [Bdellovibrionota bacterium]|nr:response regulator [Bdellovibrionota bacterium]